MSMLNGILISFFNLQKGIFRHKINTKVWYSQKFIFTTSAGCFGLLVYYVIKKNNLKNMCLPAFRCAQHPKAGQIHNNGFHTVIPSPLHSCTHVYSFYHYDFKNLQQLRNLEMLTFIFSQFFIRSCKSLRLFSQTKWLSPKWFFWLSS